LYVAELPTLCFAGERFKLDVRLYQGAVAGPVDFEVIAETKRRLPNANLIRQSGRSCRSLSPSARMASITAFCRPLKLAPYG
jgi:hypothetical protein